MQSRVRGFALSIVVFGIAAVFAQEATKPSISTSILPSEPIPTMGTCTSSTGGYLMDERGRTNLSPHDFARLVQDDLRQGYIVTVYPKTQNGYFATLKCIAKITAAHQQ